MGISGGPGPWKKTSREGLVKRCQGTGNVVFGVQDVLDLGNSAG